MAVNRGWFVKKNEPKRLQESGVIIGCMWKVVDDVRRREAAERNMK